MILIISGEEDITTNHVIDWLRFYNEPFLRISEKDPIRIISLDPLFDEKIKFQIGDNIYCLSDFHSVWYRRGWLTMQHQHFGGVDFDALDTAIERQLYQENEVLLKFFLKVLQKKSMNSQLDNSLNKLSVLEFCRELQLRIPKTLVTTDKKELISFKNAFHNIITKNFSPGVFIITDQGMLTSITQEVTDEMIDGLADQFYPMLFQEMIPKSFEIRAFYLDGKFFCSAIFSQNDEKTKVDFRNYNYAKPNRTPPYQLPEIIQLKLTRLMEKLNLKSGSLDLLVDNLGDFVFLEVNPIGQFYQVSHPCNYALEKEVAHYLMHQNERRKYNYRQ